MWDCGTGNGQAAFALADHFDVVIATDPSQAQLQQGRQNERICYAAMTGEASGLRTASVELVTVAQALHWMNRDRFYAEVRRVTRPGGMLAVWFYGLLTIEPAIDALVAQFYSVEMGRYWPPERAVIDAGFDAIEFPFRQFHVPPFAMEVSWTLDQFAGYLSTWSAVNRYAAAVGEHPVAAFIERLRPAWGAPDSPRLVRWPLRVRAGTVDPA